MRNNLFFLAAGIGFFLCFSNCSTSTEKKKSDDAAIISEGYLNHHDSAKYVGIETCRQCHSEIYESYIRTGMGQSWGFASKQKSAADFNTKAIYDKFLDLYYFPFFIGDTMKMMEFRLHGKDTTFKRVQRVSYIVGSGQHTNSHLLARNGFLFQMPLTYYTQQKVWDLPPGFEKGNNSRFSRKIGLECMACHNAASKFVESSENKYEYIANGIDCERCHGPGSIHVQYKKNGEIVDASKYIDYTIVNPGKLPADLQFDVCQRCHLQGNTVLADGKSFYDFIPGKKLSDYMITFLPRYEGDEDEFIMASHADRLKMSSCYKNSNKDVTQQDKIKNRNTLTCVTCHNPHVSVKETGKEVFNSSCRNCHSSGKSTCSIEMTERQKVEDNCIRCHMPRSGSIDIPHVSVTDHFIRKPVAVPDVKKIKKFLGLYSINVATTSFWVKARAYINQFEKFGGEPYMLDSAYTLLPHTTDGDIEKYFDELVQIAFLQKKYSRVVEYASRIGDKKIMNTSKLNEAEASHKAWTYYRVGESYMQNNEIGNAELFFSKAASLLPYNLEFKNKLAVVYTSAGSLQKAKKIFTNILKEDNEHVLATVNLGYVYLLEGNFEKAEEWNTKAGALDPDNEQLLLNKAQLHIINRQYDMAKKLLNEVLRKYPDNKKAKEALHALKSSK